MKFRNLAILQIIVETMAKFGIKVTEPTVTIADIRGKYRKASESKRSQTITRITKDECKSSNGKTGGRVDSPKRAQADHGLLLRSA